MTRSAAARLGAGTAVAKPSGRTEGRGTAGTADSLGVELLAPVRVLGVVVRAVEADDAEDVEDADFAAGDVLPERVAADVRRVLEPVRLPAELMPVPSELPARRLVPAVLVTPEPRLPVARLTVLPAEFPVLVTVPTVEPTVLRVLLTVPPTALPAVPLFAVAVGEVDDELVTALAAELPDVLAEAERGRANPPPRASATVAPVTAPTRCEELALVLALVLALAPVRDDAAGRR